MKRGVLEVKATYCKPDSSARPICSFRVLCACCAQRGGGSGSRRSAREELRAAGWKFERSRGGWHCPSCAPVEPDDARERSRAAQRAHTLKVREGAEPDPSYAHKGNPCALCGGTVGRLINGEHALCRARANRGLTILCLGHRCKVCNGVGRITRSPVGPASTHLNQAAIDAWARKCGRCQGTGVEPGTREDPTLPGVGENLDKLEGGSQ